MSILIRGMEMPKNCDVCFMRDACEYSMPLGKRLTDCPLVEVPTPHGRLIDADALVEILLKVIDINASIEQRNEATEQERRCLWWFEQQIGIAPTIIPSEEDE